MLANNFLNLIWTHIALSKIKQDVGQDLVCGPPRVTSVSDKEYTIWWEKIFKSVKHLQICISTCLVGRFMDKKMTLEKKERKDRDEGNLERKIIITKGVQTYKSLSFSFFLFYYRYSTELKDWLWAR